VAGLLGERLLVPFTQATAKELNTQATIQDDTVHSLEIQMKPLSPSTSHRFCDGNKVSSVHLTLGCE